MAGALFGGAFLSAFLQVAFDRLASREVLDFLNRRKLNDGLLQKLRIMLLSADVVLNDAEEKQITNPAVKEWLDELQDAVYDADDLLDEIVYEGLRCKLQAESQTGTSEVHNSTPPVNSFKKIVTKLEIIIQQMGVLGLKEIADGVPLPSPQITTSCQEKCGVFGRDMDKETIFELWQSDDASNDEILVVPIVGMGGIGKTTLAQFVYNDSRVDERFDLKAWVCVSVNFDSFKMSKTIIEEVTGKASDLQNLNSLQTEIQKTLKGKKFFLVLDDVWNENYNKWDDFLKVFKCGAQEVKIIVTTRSDRVAKIVRTVPAHHYLKELADGKCWDLFVQHAFGNGKSSADLEVIGNKIVNKCRGLPLAIKTLGGLLRSNQNPMHWNKISKNHIWDLPEAKTNILPALRLSYHCLPSHLKRCFAYCSIFPKGYEFKKEELILFWMAEDLLQQPKGNRSMELEEIGEEYFNDLVSRSFFQQSNQSESYFLMHDLINDLAKSISGKFCFRLENDDSNEITKKTRYLSYYRASFDASKKFEIPYEAKGLRSFLVEEWLSFRWDECKNHMDELFQAFKFLRVLSLVRCTNMKDLPESVGDLKHLRCLCLLVTTIERLPDSLCDLYNLQTLMLAPFITELPTKMSKLINLRHLDNRDNIMEKMPPQMGKMENLRKLPIFFVGKDNEGSSITELGKLQHLSGELSIMNLENVHCIDKNTTEVILKNKHNLSKLELTWTRGHNTNDQEKVKYLLEQLCPHENLNFLTIENYEGTSFPNWLGDSSFSYMVFVKLYNCKYCSSLPTLGPLPNLKYLEIEGFDAVSSVDLEFYRNDSSMIKPFRALECLNFTNMPQWQKWIMFEGEVFSCLQELHIRNCPNLNGGLPKHLPSLIKLCIEGCKKLVASLPSAPALHELNCDGKIEMPSVLYYPSLESMTLEGGCDSLWSFPLDLFPKLKSIKMNKCENLESLSASKESHQHLTSLEIMDCSNFVSFPSGGLCAQKLAEMKVSNCKKLKSLPKGMHTLLPSRVTLQLFDCPELESFPKDGLPSNLRKLKISNCDKLISHRMDLGLHGLHSLQEFYIESKCEEVESFPEDTLLPPTLTHFTISKFPNLKFLNSKGFQHLTSLKILTILDCINLECFPEEGLPASLSNLETYGCPMLKEWCEKKENGKDWLKSTYIPDIYIS